MLRAFFLRLLGFAFGFALVDLGFAFCAGFAWSGVGFTGEGLLSLRRIVSLFIERFRCGQACLASGEALSVAG